MNETIKTIKGRRAVRNFKDKEIDKKLIDQILDCGILAPSARNLQPWKFIVISNKELIKEIERKIKNKVIDDPRYPFVKERSKTMEDVILYHAPVVVFILGEKDNKWSKIDCGLAAENMMLAAQSLGICSCPIGMARYIKEEPELKKKLNFPENYEFILAIAFGYSDAQPELKERKRDVFEWID